MAPDRVFPDSGVPAAAPPGSYYNKDQYQIPPPATYRQRRKGCNPCCCCLLWLCSILAILVALVGLAILIFWLVVHPKAPQFEVNAVQVSGITDPSPTINYTITARNPNKKMGFYYSDINVKLEVNGDNVGQGTVNDFYQGHENRTSIDGVIASSISQGTRNTLVNESTNAPIYGQVDLKVKIKVGAIKTGKVKVKVQCNIYLDLTRPTGSQLKSSSCQVKW